MYKRILSIGDIKGQYGKLLSLCDKIKFNPAEDLLVLHGDYLDLGPDPRWAAAATWQPLEVLDWLMERRGEQNVVMLRGNREQMMLDYFMDKETQRKAGGPFAPEDTGEDWFPNHGDATHEALWNHAARIAREQGTPEEQTMGVYLDFMTGLLDFIGEMPLSHRVEVGGKTYFFSHAGARPGVPLEEQKAEDLLWIREKFYAPRLLAEMRPGVISTRNAYDAVVVAAHTPVQNVRRQFYMEPINRPIIRDNMILVDTAGWVDGYPLSCVDVLSGQVEQSD